ncbi:GDT1-like protein 1, chloroplastic isoform X2 [Tasmannia lanceolata]|uniref:GDT1-like protein 1, chloroplastic isoform X2 n=1 Tax=Tasmannia lanceolata TaxID=3420 RepID=UPI004063689F
MQTLTLCEGVFGANFKPSFPNLFKSSITFPLFPFSQTKSKLSRRNSSVIVSRHPRQWPQYASVDEVSLGHIPQTSSINMRDITKSKLSRRNSCVIVSRHPGQWPQYASVSEVSLGHIPQTSSINMRDIELKFLDDKSSKATSRLVQIQHYSGGTDRSLAEISLMNEDHILRPFKHDAVPVSNASFHSALKFAVLFGLLSFQGSPQAAASSDSGNAMQSIAYLGDFGDLSTGFASAFLLIFFSELGDKTFFIAAILAARNSAAIVFIGTFGALAAMTFVSVALGRTFHYVDDILPFRLGETELPIDDIAAVCLLVYFGVSTLLGAASSDGLKTEEEQKEAELAVSKFSGNGSGIIAAANTVISTFFLVFVAEWALAAASSPLGVIGGALAGHAVATSLAVLGGSLFGTFFSEKVIAYVGGVLFLVFAVVTLIEIVSQVHIL